MAHGHHRYCMGADLRFAFGLTAAAFLLELLGGLYSNSLALLGDSGHVFSDALSIGVAYYAFRLAHRPSTPRRTFGYHRAEVFASLLNGLALVLIGCLLAWSALARLSAPPEVNALGMGAFALVGLAANALVVIRLKGYDNLNVKAAMFHALSDALASASVVAGAFLIGLTGLSAIDTILSLAISLIILSSAYKVLRGSLSILFESSPRGITAEKICAALGRVKGVKGAHDIHVWCICSDIVYVTAHVLVDDRKVSGTGSLAKAIARELKKLGVSHTVFQFETACSSRGGVGMTCDINH